MLFIDMNMMNNGDDREEVENEDPDRECPGGERGGETHFEYILRAAG